MPQTRPPRSRLRTEPRGELREASHRSAIDHPAVLHFAKRDMACTQIQSYAAHDRPPLGPQPSGILCLRARGGVASIACRREVGPFSQHPLLLGALFRLFVESGGSGSAALSLARGRFHAVQRMSRARTPGPLGGAVETAGPVDKLQGELAHRPLDNPAGCPQSPQPPRPMFVRSRNHEERRGVRGPPIRYPHLRRRAPFSFPLLSLPQPSPALRG